MRENNLYNKGIDLFNAGRLEESLKYFKEELKKDEDNYYLYYWIGLAYRHLEDFDKAIKYTKKSIDLNPKVEFSYLNLGICLQLQDNFKEAIEAFNIAIKINNYLTTAYNSLGLTYKKMGNFKKALEIYTKAIEVLFDNICNNLSENQIRKLVPHEDVDSEKWHEFAIKAFIKKSANDGMESVLFPTGETALKFYEEGKDSDSWVDLNGKRQMMPQYTEVVRVILSSKSLYSILANNMGSVLVNMGRKKEAKEWFVESIAFIPQDVNYPDPYFALKELE
jgi:tetratricopeptide (TPR) repeat protein